MNDEPVKLFDYNDNLVPNFDLEIEKILISVHGENYYDVDEEITNTNYIPIDEVKAEEKKENVEEVKKEEKSKNKTKFSEFIPVLFFILLFVIIVVAGYYFLNTVDLTNLIK